MSTLNFPHWRPEKAASLAAVRFDKGIDGYLDVRTVTLEPGLLVAEMDVRPDMITMIGNLHGGCLAALCDHCLGFTLYPIMPPRSWAATTEFKINYLAPVSTGVVRATTTVMAMTSRTAVLRVEMENEGRTVALAQGTCLIVAPKSS